MSKFIEINVLECQCLPPECIGCPADNYCNAPKENAPRKGMLVNVYATKDGSDCTNGGITSYHKQLIMVGKGIPEIFKAKADGSNCIEYVEREMFGKECNICVPLNQPELKKMNGPMFGGNFVYTSDSRFPHNNPVPVHDRFESW